MTTADERTRSQASFALRELLRALRGGLLGLWRALLRAIDKPLAVAARAAKTVTPLGWIVVCAAIVSFLLAFVLGWAEFAFIGFALAGGTLAACAYLFGRATYKVAIELNPRRVTAGDRVMGRMEVVNTGPRPVLPTRMELPVGEGLAEFVVPRLAPNADDESLFADSDLVVVADGINSRFRERYADHFQPEVDLRPNKFTWMGSTKPLDAFTFIFQETEWGPFIAHAYQYEANRSTWVFETDP